MIPTEHQEQSSLIQWANMSEGKYPDLKRLFAIPNGGHRHKATAAKLKAEGVRKGVLDLCLPVARGGYHGLFIEMKRIKGSYPTKDQKEEISELRADGYRAEVCKGWESAKDVLIDYLGENIPSGGYMMRPELAEELKKKIVRQKEYENAKR